MEAGAQRKAPRQGCGGVAVARQGPVTSISSPWKSFIDNLEASVHLLSQERRNIEVVLERAVVRQTLLGNVERERTDAARAEERALGRSGRVGGQRRRGCGDRCGGLHLCVDCGALALVLGATEAGRDDGP